MQAYVFNANSEPTSTTSSFDDTTDVNSDTFLDILINGDTSDLLDRYFDPSTRPIVLDVRSQTEFEDCSEMTQFAPMAASRIINIPNGQLLHLNKKSLQKNFGIREEDTVVCICATGNRSAQGTKKLRALGFDCFNLYGGMKSFAKNYGRKVIRKLARA